MSDLLETPSLDEFSLAGKILEENEKKKEEEESENNSSGQIKSSISEYYMGSTLNWLSLDLNKEVVFYPLGLPYLSRTKNWHPKKIFTKKVISDANQMMPLIYPQLKDRSGNEQNVIDEDWIFYRMLKKISERTWDKSIAPPKNAKKHYDGWWKIFHENTEIFQRLEFNKPSEKFLTTSAFGKPREMVIMQVISRMDGRNEETQRPSILTTNFTIKTVPDRNNKKDQNGEIITYKNYYVEYGIAESVYLELLEKSFLKFGHWAIDHSIKRHKDNQGNYTQSISTSADTGLSRELQLKMTPANISYDVEIINGREIKDAKVGITPLSKEESLIKPYNLDELFAPTSYQDLFNFYAHTFKLCDLEIGTGFYDELMECVKNECGKYPTDSQYKKSKIAELVDLNSGVKVTPKIDVSESKIPDLPVMPTEHLEPPVNVKDSTTNSDLRVNVESITDSEGIKSALRIIYPEFDKLPDIEKNAMLSDIESITNGLPVYKQATDIKCDCKKTFIKLNGESTDFPVRVHVNSSMCAFCGSDF